MWDTLYGNEKILKIAIFKGLIQPCPSYQKPHLLVCYILWDNLLAFSFILLSKLWCIYLVNQYNFFGSGQVIILTLCFGLSLAGFGRLFVVMRIKQGL